MSGAYLQIGTRTSYSVPADHKFFLELDRSTEILDTLVGKAACYLNYYRSGGFAIRNGSSRSRFRDFPFRVLFVLKSRERRNNLARRLLAHSPPILTLTYLTTFEEVSRDPLGDIWIRPLDLRETLDESEYNGRRQHTVGPYRRNQLRKALIEGHISKHRLF